MNNNYMPPYGANFRNSGNNFLNSGNYNGFNYNTPQANSFAWVNGSEGAKAYIVPPNSTTVLLDSEKPFLYIKNADMYGRAELKVYEYKECKEPAAIPPTDYATKQELTAIKEELTILKKELTQSLKGVLKDESVYTDNAVNEQRQSTADCQSNTTK